jgi:hypothetical protein
MPSCRGARLEHQQINAHRYSAAFRAAVISTTKSRVFSSEDAGRRQCLKDGLLSGAPRRLLASIADHGPYISQIMARFSAGLLGDLCSVADFEDTFTGHGTERGSSRGGHAWARLSQPACTAEQQDAQRP